ncbi:MAG: hypothetical protein SangKO_047710 [Sandaracinaceae bacterium]
MIHRILIITIDEALADALHAALAHWGYDCVTCRDASDALREAGEQAPRGVIVDTEMPYVDALDVVTALRQHGPTANTAAIAILPSLAEDVLELATGRGCDRGIARPIDPDWIAAEIDRVAQLRLTAAA